MGKIWTIAARTYKHYFISPMAYVIAVALFFIVGFLFESELASSISASAYGGGSVPSTQNPIWYMFYLFLFAMPALAAWLLADENRLGTMELLLTSPVNDAQLVIGKWLGSVLCSLTFIAFSWVYEIFLYIIIKPSIDQGPLVSAYLVLLFAFGAMIAICMVPSALFSNSTAAFFGGFGIMLILFLFEIVTSLIPQSVAPQLTSAISYMSFTAHFRDTALAGKLQVQDLVYYASLIVFGLFLTTRIVESKRWR
jgi:ABC-2 type transport system permease protein